MGSQGFCGILQVSCGLGCTVEGPVWRDEVQGLGRSRGWVTNTYTEGVKSLWRGIWQGLKSAMQIFVCFRSIFLPAVCMIDGRGWNRQGD